MVRSDEELLREYSECRSDEAFRVLAKRHGPIVYGACLRHLRDPELAEDAAQAVFLVLAEKASKIRVHTTLVPWCLATAKNVCRRLARSEFRRRRHERALTNDIEAENDGSDAALFAALERLRSDEREAIVLRFVQGLSLAEVGQAQGVTEDAARMRVNRGLARLKRKVVIPVAVPGSLMDRLSCTGEASPAIRALAYTRPLSAVIAPAAFAFVGIGAVVTVGATVLPKHARPVISSPLKSATSASVVVKHDQAQPSIGVLDKPFTLVYRFAITSLAPQKAVDANLAIQKKQIDADLDADKISVQEHDRQIAEAVSQSKIRRREGVITLSYDGEALLVKQTVSGPGINEQQTLFRSGQTFELLRQCDLLLVATSDHDRPA